MPTFEIENSFNLDIIAGIDEAGRGPLCGPVFSGCVILNKNFSLKGINDSKKITEKHREELFEKLLELEKCGEIFFDIGEASIDEIEKVNIRNATKLSMQRAYFNLVKKYNNKKIDLVLVDGNFVPDIDTKAEFIIKGDEKSLSIATASIIAKVSRDRFVRKLDLEFPQYNWKQNKGYGTKEHMEAIKVFGLSPHHRKSFIHI